MPNRLPLAWRRPTISCRTGLPLFGAVALLAVVAGPTAAQSGFPRTIKHKLGSTTISKAPVRIVALGEAEQDDAIALGVTPVGITKDIAAGNGLAPWENRRLRGKKFTVINGDTGVPFEKVAALKPDVILGFSDFTLEKDYPTLAQIAPTIGFINGSFKDSYQAQMRLVGRTLGREAAAERVLTSVNHQILSVRRSHPKFKGKTLTLAFMSDANTIGVVTDPHDPTIRLINQLGVGVSKSVQALQQKGNVQGTISLEQLGNLQADALVLAYASPALKRQLESNKVFKGLPVVKRGGYSEMDLATITGLREPSVLSVPYALDKLTAALNKATR